MSVTTTTVPAVWLGCLGCYNAGRLRGQWVDADELDDWTDALGPDYVDDDGRCSRADCGAEEWWCFDHQGYGGLVTGEPTMAEAMAVAEAIYVAGSYGLSPEELAGFVDYYGRPDDPDEWGELVKLATENYHGVYRSEREWAQEYAEAVGYVNDDDWASRYIDWDAVARDWMMDHVSVQVPGGVAIFSVVTA